MEHDVVGFVGTNGFHRHCGVRWPDKNARPPRLYRFRVLNASNARFFRLSLGNGQSFYQIGTDQGMLPRPVEIKRLAIAPGERADLLVDFGAQQSERVVLKNEAMDVMQFRVTKAAGSAGTLPAAPASLLAWSGCRKRAQCGRGS